MSQMNCVSLWVADSDKLIIQLSVQAYLKHVGCPLFAGFFPINVIMESQYLY